MSAGSIPPCFAARQSKARESLYVLPKVKGKLFWDQIRDHNYSKDKNDGSDPEHPLCTATMGKAPCRAEPQDVRLCVGTADPRVADLLACP